MACIYFNPRTREGCDTRDYPDAASIKLISIHAPVKGATSSGRDASFRPFYFNPRTREGCDQRVRDDLGGEDLISIHAPVKGATSKDFPARSRTWISIHAPVKGATLFYDPQRRPGLYFNPRTREGCDGAGQSGLPGRPDFNPRTREGCDFTSSVIYHYTVAISIHAPVKGATL